MSTQARDEILARLKSAQRGVPGERPSKPALSETGLNREGMLQRFTAELSAQTGTVYQAENGAEAMRSLAAIATAEGLRSFLVSGEALDGIDLKAFGSEHGITVTDVREAKNREDLREAAFSVDAGVTFADFAVAESGTIGLVFHMGQPRLPSIAPPVHIALLPLEKLYPVYEAVGEQVFGDREGIPSQFVFITGPSSTGDIQGVHFKGMHGPGKIFVIFITGQK